MSRTMNSIGGTNIICEKCGHIFDVIIEDTDQINDNNEIFELKCMYCNQILKSIKSTYKIVFNYKNKPTNFNKMWTFHDDIELFSGIEEYQTANDISICLNRTLTSIRKRVERIFKYYKKHSNDNNMKLVNDLEHICQLNLCLNYADDGNIYYNKNIEQAKFTKEQSKKLEDIFKFIVIEGNYKYSNIKNSDKCVRWLNDISEKEKIQI